VELVRRVSIIDERPPRSVRMANLAIAGSHTVNGVAAIHTEIIQQTIFADFHHLYPERIINVTNGITPRRWLNQANPALAQLISEYIGPWWLTRLDELGQLEELAEHEDFRAAFAAVKLQNKQMLAAIIERRLGIEVDPGSLFDVQIKRIHEYKRQLLNLLHVIDLYDRMRSDPDGGWVPRTVIFSGKAAPSYRLAKQVIKLIHDVADVVNRDPRVQSLLKVVFLPNYDVSTAADIIPAAELSQQISMAGTEASGTGNMKLALNGALTIGTLDGANVEIREAVGEENVFIFGRTRDQVAELLRAGYRPERCVAESQRLRRVLEQIASGYFSPEEPDRHRAIYAALSGDGDRYLVCADFDAYLQAQAAVEALYRDPDRWNRSAILNVARMGPFSSDRAIREYAEKIWRVQPVPQRPLGEGGCGGSD
jgi:starch phosphorylase